MGPRLLWPHHHPGLPIGELMLWLRTGMHGLHPKSQAPHNGMGVSSLNPKGLLEAGAGGLWLYGAWRVLASLSPV